MSDPPPFFRRWRSVYLIVIGTLVLVIILLYLLTLRYA